MFVFLPLSVLSSRINLYFYHNKKNCSKKKINQQSLAQTAGRIAPGQATIDNYKPKWRK
jgi:hypothetical protein